MEQSTFNMIPAHDELASLPREFSFRPSEVHLPRTLTKRQVEQYNRDGFVPRVQVFDADEAGEIREYFDRLLARELAAGGTSYSISTAHLAHGRVYDLLADPRITASVRDILGEDVIGWG